MLVFSLSCKSEEDKYEVQPPPNSEFDMKIERAPTKYKENSYNSWIGVDFDNKKSDSSQTKISKQIIKDGEIALITDDIDKTKKILNEQCKKYNAYFGSENLDNDDYYTTYKLYVRIPAENFEGFIESLDNGDNEVQSKSFKVRDVTSDYFDLETRLKTKRDYYKKYTELLSRAKSVADILEIEENIRVLQEDIESTEGSFRILKDKIAYSNLIVEIIKKKEYIYKAGQRDNFFERVKSSLNNGWISIVDFLIWSITLWPYMILLFTLLLLIKRFRKKRRYIEE